ncbi:SH3 domain-containing protein [Silicimonas algicola]|uniref:SH3 domain-containing protein n=1 Tax=Silicimonas algicola TaxID=1826607 RepID=A0A316G797_9RHOB|nr:SH3 domain-containing protein [Silicimonas algicola]
MLYKLSAATLAAFVAVLHFAGDVPGPEVARASNASDATGLSLAAFSLSPETEKTVRRNSSLVSEEEAVRLALEAGARVRSEREIAPLRGAVASAVADTGDTMTDADPVGDLVPSDKLAGWVVTGDSVNLRNGPGTGNAVVGQVVLGTKADVLDSKDGWHLIETADGASSGWIFGKFLDERQPG